MDYGQDSRTQGRGGGNRKDGAGSWRVKGGGE